MYKTSPKGQPAIRFIRMVVFTGTLLCISSVAIGEELPQNHCCLWRFDDGDPRQSRSLREFAGYQPGDRGSHRCRSSTLESEATRPSNARQRFQADVLKHKPDLTIIQFGINDAAVDVWRTPAATTPHVDLQTFDKNLRYFCQTLKAHQCKVILMTPNPLAWTDKLKALYGKAPYDPEDEDGFNLFLKRYAAAVRKIAKEEKVQLVDVYKEFSDYANREGRSIQELLLDGMHPNSRGHQLIAIQLSEIISQALSPNGLIASITKETLWSNRDGKSLTWFHPRACMIPGKDGKPAALMTLQEIGGSDYFGPVHWSTLER